MSDEFRLLAWGVYVVASLFLTVFSWLITRNWKPRVLARVFRVWLAVVLLTPAYIEPGSLALAPAWLARYRMGPMEWLWRSLTYWSRQPLRR